MNNFSRRRGGFDAFSLCLGFPQRQTLRQADGTRRYAAHRGAQNHETQVSKHSRCSIRHEPNTFHWLKYSFKSSDAPIIAGVKRIKYKSGPRR